MSVSGRVVIVTGAGRGLGRGYALDLASRGAHVVVNDLGVAVDGRGRDSVPAEQVVEEIRLNGGSAVAHAGDASSQQGVQDLFECALASFGRVDGCVVNAGIIRSGIPFDEIGEGLFEAFVRTHVFGAWWLAQQAWRLFVPQMRGRLMFVTSSAAIYGMAGNAGYAMTKSAILGLVRTLAAEGSEHGILVNGVCPHAWSRMATSVDNHDGPTLQTAMQDAVPISAVAPVAAALMSDDLNFTGRILSVGGGHVGMVYAGETRGIRVSSAGYEPSVFVDEWPTISDLENAVVADDAMAAFHALIADHEGSR
jgi:NAD(P)-dependent dehydrogenase (short-subunit alcohol dehydrogenase family)